MGKQSKPGQSKPLAQMPPAQPTELTAEQRAKTVEQAVIAACQQFQCTPVIAQKMLDGQLHPLTGVPLMLIFVPNEKLSAPSVAQTDQPAKAGDESDIKQDVGKE